MQKTFSITQAPRLIACEGKREFMSWYEADRFLRKRKTRGRRKTKNKLNVGIYKCSFGNHFHIGSSLQKEIKNAQA